MSIFGWRLTNKKPHIESDMVQELHRKLEVEQKHRENEAFKAANKEVELKLLLSKAEAEENERQKRLTSKNRTQALNHLRMAERYYEQMTQSLGARKTELRAIVDKRVEQAENLGFKLKGTISETITRLS
jgi:hypothetical protein